MTLIEKLEQIQNSLLRFYHKLQRRLKIYYYRFLRRLDRIAKYLAKAIPFIVRVGLLFSPVWIFCIGVCILAYKIGGFPASIVSGVITFLAAAIWLIRDTADREKPGSGALKLTFKTIILTLGVDIFIFWVFVIAVVVWDNWRDSIAPPIQTAETQSSTQTAQIKNSDPNSRESKNTNQTIREEPHSKNENTVETANIELSSPSVLYLKIYRVDPGFRDRESNKFINELVQWKLKLSYKSLNSRDQETVSLAFDDIKSFYLPRDLEFEDEQPPNGESENENEATPPKKIKHKVIPTIWCEASASEYERLSTVKIGTIFIVTAKIKEINGIDKRPNAHNIRLLREGLKLEF